VRSCMRRVGRVNPMKSNDAEITAGEWLARLDRGDPSPEDAAEFERWKSSDPRHVAAYARLAAAWQALNRVQAMRPGAAEPIDEDYLNCQSEHTRSAPAPAPAPAPASKSRSWAYISLAASLLLGAAGLWISRGSSGPQTYNTGVGGFQRIVLEDQSAIELNTDSEVRVELSRQLRKVELVRGEASFEVSHDAARPFIVSAGTTGVRAVGTKFDVRRLGDSVEVTVDEGKVAIGTPSLLETAIDVSSINIPQISAGQAASARGADISLKTLAKSELAQKIAWQNQMLIFDGDSLADVVMQFNRYNGRQLVIADPALAALKIGGYFRPTNLDAFVDVLQSNFGIRVSMDGNRVLLATASAN
jgi:transmembrane sensor